VYVSLEIDFLWGFVWVLIFYGFLLIVKYDPYELGRGLGDSASYPLGPNTTKPAVPKQKGRALSSPDSSGSRTWLPNNSRKFERSLPDCICPSFQIRLPGYKYCSLGACSAAPTFTSLSFILGSCLPYEHAHASHSIRRLLCHRSCMPRSRLPLLEP
jgi:hypothetical protein